MPQREARQWWDLALTCRAWQNCFISVTVGNKGDCLQAAVTHISFGARLHSNIHLSSALLELDSLFWSPVFLVFCFCIFELSALKKKKRAKMCVSAKSSGSVPDKINTRSQVWMCD